MYWREVYEGYSLHASGLALPGRHPGSAFSANRRLGDESAPNPFAGGRGLVDGLAAPSTGTWPVEHHSDQGNQYRATLYQTLLADEASSAA